MFLISFDYKRYNLFFNDSFGVGRLYCKNENENEYIMSNSIHAILLASNQVIQLNNDYWSSYYVSGGGLGKSTYIRGINLASPGSILKLSLKDSQ